VDQREGADVSPLDLTQERGGIHALVSRGATASPGRPEPPMGGARSPPTHQNRSTAKLTTDRAISVAACWSAPSDAVIVSATVPGTAKSARSA
jgi:hypothetical protein